jgi:uncharacterized protein (TIGR02231 family)
MSTRAAAFIAAAVFSVGALAQDIGRVSRVTLYPGSATVERAVRVGAGSGRVEMTGLPASFDPRTLRVEGDAGIRIGEVAVQDIGRAEALSAREADLEQRLQSLKDEKAELDVDAKTAELVRNYLASLGSRDEKEKIHAVDPKAIPAIVEAIRRGGADAYGTIQKVEVRKRELDKRIAALERDLARLRTGARDVRSLWIGYTAAKGGELRAAYHVTNAGWKPAYRAELDSNASKMDLEREAAVMQRTGEDWRGVTLRLSTGAPRATQVVEPQPWQLVIRPPVQPLARGGVASEMMAASPAAKAMRADEAKDAIVEQFQTAYSTEFEVPGKVDVASDGRQITVALSSQELPVRQRIRVVPRRGVEATVTAEAEQPEGVWIPGEVQLYRDGSYIGKTYWNAQAKEKIVLPFGRDDRVVVKSDRVKSRGGETGIISKRGERQIADLYTVTSRHKVAVDLLVLEASPVPVSDQINVETTFQPQPKVKEWENKRGVVAWEQLLSPGETANFTVDYTISYPRDANVIGLP